MPFSRLYPPKARIWDLRKLKQVCIYGSSALRSVIWTQMFIHATMIPTLIPNPKVAKFDTKDPVTSVAFDMSGTYMAVG